MTGWECLGLALAVFCMGLGTLASLFPAIPGTPIVLVTAILHKLIFGPAGASGWVLAFLCLLTAGALLLDYLAGLYGARRFGATWRGVLGAVLGSIVGIFFSLPGILLGPLVGALLLEMAGGRKFKESARAGAGAFLGVVAGAAGKFAVCIVMTLLFATSVISRSAG